MRFELNRLSNKCAVSIASIKTTGVMNLKFPSTTTCLITRGAEQMELTGADIVKIIKACKEAGVKTLKLGEIEVHFSDLKHKQIIPPGFEKPEVIKVDFSENSKDISEAPVPHIERNTNLNPEEEFDDDELMFNDPLEWERRQMNKTVASAD